MEIKPDFLDILNDPILAANKLNISDSESVFSQILAYDIVTLLNIY